MFDTVETVDALQTAMDAILAQYNAGVINSAARDAASNAYNLKLMQLQSSSGISSKALTIVGLGIAAWILSKAM